MKATDREIELANRKAGKGKQTKKESSAGRDRPKEPSYRRVTWTDPITGEQRSGKDAVYYPNGEGAPVTCTVAGERVTFYTKKVPEWKLVDKPQIRIVKTFSLI